MDFSGDYHRITCMNPQLSVHFSQRQPSAIRLAQIAHMKRTDQVEAINTAIGNVSLPMHPAMQERLFNLKTPPSPFTQGVVKYSATIGFPETNQAFLNIIAASHCQTQGLFSQITDGASQAMELVILGVCGRAGKSEAPLLLIDAAYTNYMAMAQRVGRQTVSFTRTLQPDGSFSLPDLSVIEKIISTEQPQALLVIPYDNPTGQFFNHQQMVDLATICVKHNLWMISDEAYRELQYQGEPMSSIWKLTEKEVPGITGRRISLESASKVWNACGLRVGAIVTDNQQFHEKCVAENTANLCSNVIGQYIFGALAHQSHEQLQDWFASQRQYYQEMMTRLSGEIKQLLPQIIISIPSASIYSVVDVRQMVDKNFDAKKFVLWCAEQGKVDIKGQAYTLLVSPMQEFYSVAQGQDNPGRTQMRIAYVETPERIKLVPPLFAKLLKQYLG